MSFTSTCPLPPPLLGALEAGLLCRDGFLADGGPLGVGRGHLVLLSQGGVDHLGTGDGELRIVCISSKREGSLGLQGSLLSRAPHSGLSHGKDPSGSPSPQPLETAWLHPRVQNLSRLGGRHLRAIEHGGSPSRGARASSVFLGGH